MPASSHPSLNGTTPAPLQVLATIDSTTLPPAIAQQLQQLLAHAEQLATITSKIQTAQQQFNSSHQQALAGMQGVRTLPSSQSTALRAYAEVVRGLVDQYEDLAARAEALATILAEAGG